MEKPRPAYREVTDPENAPIMGTLNPKLWATFKIAEARAHFYELDGAAEPETEPDAIDWLMGGIRMTGALNGDTRRDLVEALKGQKPPTVAMGVAVPDAAAANGHARRVPSL